MKGVIVYCLLIFLFAIILTVLKYLLHKLFNREYNKTIERCSHHVIGKISENNCIWERKYIGQGRYNKDIIYHVLLKYIFTINGIQNVILGKG